jgi:hypothetical protein
MTFDFLEHASAEPGTSCAGLGGPSRWSSLTCPIAQKAHHLGIYIDARLLVGLPLDHAKPHRQVQGRAVAPVAALGKRPLATFLIVRDIAALTLGGLLVEGASFGTAFFVPYPLATHVTSLVTTFYKYIATLVPLH